MIELFQEALVERSGKHEYSIRLLHEFGKSAGYLTPNKISQIYAEVRKHSVLFSDHTEGKAEPFLAVLFNPASVWLEIFSLDQEKPVGVVYISHVIPNFDAKGHFVVWDGVASERKVLFLEIMDWMFTRYNLQRISAETPPYQSGVIRFITKHLGMQKEGVKRNAVLYKGKWYPLIQFGLLREEWAAQVVEATKTAEPFGVVDALVREGVQSLNNSPNGARDE